MKIVPMKFVDGQVSSIQVFEDQPPHEVIILDGRCFRFTDDGYVESTCFRMSSVQAKVLIVTPMYEAKCSGIFSDSMQRAANLYTRLGFQIQQLAIYGSLVTASRTTAAQVFMETNCTHLLFIDADIGFHPEYVLELVNVQLATGYDIIGAPYMKKSIRWDKVISYVSTQKDLTKISSQGTWTVETLDKKELDFTSGDPVEVYSIGAGFMLIPRATFELFTKTYPEYIYNGGTKTYYFPSGIMDDSLVSEDVMFCHHVRRAGGRVGCCPWMRLAHVGTHTYGEASFNTEIDR